LKHFSRLVVSAACNAFSLYLSVETYSKYVLAGYLKIDQLIKQWLAIYTVTAWLFTQ